MNIQTDQPALTSDEPTGKADRSVLVVDDSRTIRISVQQLLRPHGFTVFTARNGYEALSVAAQQHPGVVLMDLIMPRLDGYETCSLMKRHPGLGTTPVVMLSGKNRLFDRARGLMAGSDHFIRKPFSGDTLLNVICECMGIKL